MTYRRFVIRSPSPTPASLPPLSSKTKALAWINKPTIDRKVPPQENDLFLLFRDEDPVAFSLKTDHGFVTHHAPMRSMRMLNNWTYDPFWYSWNVFWLENNDPDDMIDALFTLRVKIKVIAEVLFRALLDTAPHEQIIASKDFIDTFDLWLHGKITKDQAAFAHPLHQNTLGYDIVEIYDMNNDSARYTAITHAISMNSSEETACDLIRKYFPLEKLLQALAEFQ